VSSYVLVGPQLYVGTSKYLKTVNLTPGGRGFIATLLAAFQFCPARSSIAAVLQSDRPEEVLNLACGGGSISLPPDVKNLSSRSMASTLRPLATLEVDQSAE
jgi:hypothetical protein